MQETVTDRTIRSQVMEALDGGHASYDVEAIVARLIESHPHIVGDGAPGINGVETDVFWGIVAQYLCGCGCTDGQR